MPPWGAVKGVGEFLDDPSLSQPEIDLLVSWVEGGAPEGEPVYLPPAPRFESTPEPKPPAKAEMHSLASSAPWTLEQPLRLVSVRPLELPEGGSLEVMAACPDGSVKHLIWLRDYRKEWQRTFVFQNPVSLPRGTRLSVWSAAPATVAIATAKPER
ncbi:MAG TPA: hypothetical protein VG672_01890, partial [Bryobacteraceae bacterium]|nr:hypothetical protein [Bryobacteraceae bacterium]